MIGETISHYKILEKLGEGGMGVVYKAEDLKLKRTVALKFLPPQALGTDEEKARFIHEAQAAAALSHANICTIHEIEEHEGRSFIAMEYIEGESLKAAIQSGPFKLGGAINIAIQVAEGLREAHEKGIVHRDIKPANIMITPRGQAKIMDFGLAKARGQTVLTKADTTLGTFAYMSPEQARGDDVDRRADIWSLGVVLYEMITGQRPFRGDYEQAMVYSILNEEPEPVTGLRSGVPMELERIAAKCLRKDPGQRYQGMADIITDLRQVSESFKTARTVSSSARRPAKTSKLIHLSWLAMAAVLIVLATQFLPRYFGTQEELVSDDRKMLVVLPFENLGSPDDEYFAAGMTEEITSRLAAVSGLGVISRTSAVNYDRTGKTLKQIGEDLGVDYVLEGTIRWDKKAADGSRIRVTPQLIRVSDDTHLWAERYDRVLEDIFTVQSDIAGRIIEQIGVTMLARERDAVESKPTENFLAYEAYMRGLVHLSRVGSREDKMRSAEKLLRQAVELDPVFALAFARLAEVHGEIYFWGFDKTDERLAKAKAAAERSLELQPDLPEAHMALGGYYYMGFFDYDRALKEYAIAAKGMPNSPDLLESVAYIWRRQGLFQEAIDYFKKAATLDPTNFWLYLQIGTTFSYLRRYAEADDYFDRSLAMDPQQGAGYFMRAMNVLYWKGDIEEVRAILESASLPEHPLIIESFFDLHIYERDYQKALNCLSELTDELYDFGTIFTPRELLVGIAYEYLGDAERARTAYESARVLLETVVQDRPKDGAAHCALGLVYAGLGQKEDAILMGKKGLTLNVDDAFRLSEREWELAVIYIKVGEHDAALNLIEHLLSVPSWVSVPFLKITPFVDPLRDHPRFKEILRKYSKGAE